MQILFGTARAGQVDPNLAWLGAPPVAQVFNLCLSIAVIRWPTGTSTHRLKTCATPAYRITPRRDRRRGRAGRRPVRRCCR